MGKCASKRLADRNVKTSPVFALFVLMARESQGGTARLKCRGANVPARRGPELFLGAEAFFFLWTDPICFDRENAFLRTGAKKWRKGKCFDREFAFVFTLLRLVVGRIWGKERAF